MGDSAGCLPFDLSQQQFMQVVHGIRDGGGTGRVEFFAGAVAVEGADAGQGVFLRADDIVLTVTDHDNASLIGQADVSSA